MDIQEAIKLAEGSLEIMKVRLEFIDCYEQAVGHVAEAIKKAVEEAIVVRELTFEKPDEGTYYTVI